MNEVNKMKLPDLMDKDIRSEIRKNPEVFMSDMLGEKMLVDEISIVVKTNTADITYVVIPKENVMAGDLASVQASGVSSAGTAATLGSVSSMCSSASTFATASSVGTLT